MCDRLQTACDETSVNKEQLPFVPVVIGREVKHTTFPTPSGALEGYQLRFQLGAPQPDGTELVMWTEWLHLPNPLMLYLTESLDSFMRDEGHLKGVLRAA